MNRLLSLLLAVALAGPLLAGVTTLTPADPSADYDSGEINVAGPNKFNVMACTTGWTGTLTFSQGPKTGKLVTTKTVSLTTSTGCTTYYRFEPSEFLQIVGDRDDAGTLDTLYIEYQPR
jgi:hypothetical protein